MRKTEHHIVRIQYLYIQLVSWCTSSVQFWFNTCSKYIIKYKIVFVDLSLLLNFLFRKQIVRIVMDWGLKQTLLSHIVNADSQTDVATEHGKEIV